MKLPIVAYGDPVLKRKCIEIDENYPDLEQLIEDMFETMYGASGVGLAAPQIGRSIRLFVVDGSPNADEDEPELEYFKKVFINPILVEEDGEEWTFTEGCLSIPDIREDVTRLPSIRINYFDEHWEEHEEEYTGLAARIIQHEYDHIEGKLFTDRLRPLRKAMLKSKLEAISKGQVDVDYRMRFPKTRRR